MLTWFKSILFLTLIQIITVSYSDLVNIQYPYQNLLLLFAYKNFSFRNSSNGQDNVSQNTTETKLLSFKSDEDIEEVFTYPNIIETLSHDTASVANGMNKFAIEFYNKLVKENSDQNAIISPFSIFTILATIYAGSSNQTADELLSTLKLNNLNDSQIINGLQEIIDLLLADIGSDNKLNITNLILFDKSFNLSKVYEARVKSTYKTKLEKVDFGANSSMKSINDYVSSLTHGNIKNLLANEPDSLTKLILTSVIHYQGKWFETFEPKFTSESIFTNSNGSESTVQMMKITTKMFIYCHKITEICAIELLYSGGALGFLILIPRHHSDLNFVESNLSPEFIQMLLNRLEERTIEFGLPRFEISGDYNLQVVLESMGIKSMFSSEQADLSQMGSDERNLFVKDAHHKSLLKVTEEGTLASGATVAVIGNRIGSPRFFIDKPFLFLIRDLRTNVILFMGRILSFP